MSMSNLSIDGEFRYIVQWFKEWSELQRDDFVYVFVEYLARSSSSNSNFSEVHVNGLVNSLASASVQDKPMSLFQCRIKLFREWSPKWPIEFKCMLQEKISEIDAKVGEKIINELRGPHSVHNGDVAVHLNANGASEEAGEPELEQPSALSVAEMAEVAAPVAGEEPAEPAPEPEDDNRLAAVLSQETPVDDDDDVVEEPAGEGSNSHADANVNGHYPAAAVTTIAVNTSPSPSPSLSPTPPQPIVEPVEQVENGVTVTVASAEVPPVA
ncbi:uncharacterized protein LOC108032030 [Drosophila biarmipes]|uniref:uncharacterized protein LOC108032030 n=1 Tax=Drosophila biarmipes TaxID=125945 RepID=UPI0007E626F3|nr:uncharacterized protein LOC108032030 [Drosophila biarmipes]